MCNKGTFIAFKILVIIINNSVIIKSITTNIPEKRFLYITY